MLINIAFSILGLLLFLIIIIAIYNKIKKRRIAQLLQNVFSKYIDVPEIDYYSDKDGMFVSVIFSFQEDYDKAKVLGLFEDFKKKFKKIEPDTEYFNSDEMLDFRYRSRSSKKR